MTNHFVLCVLHHCTYRSEEQVQNDHKFITLNKKTGYHSEQENLMSSSSQDPTSTGKPVAVFSSQNRLNQDHFPTETNLLMLFVGVTNRFSDFLTRQMLQNPFLMEMEITCSLKRDLNS